MGPQHLDLRGRVSVKPMLLYDRWLIFAAVSIIAFGLIMVASSSIGIAQQQFNQPFYYLIRQVIFLALGLILVLVILRTNMRLWQKASLYLLILSIVLLIAVLIPGVGRMVNGSMRWIAIGPFGLQVSELAKLFTIIFMANYIHTHLDEIRSQLSGFIKPLVLLALIAILLLLEPDFGATVVIAATVMGMLFLAGVRFFQFMALLLIVGLVLAALAISSPYRLVRLTTFLNPWADQFNTGYQLTQSLIAFGRGGWFGTGLGESVQKLFYLPEAHTDFLFAVLAEELGLIGCLTIISLYTLLIIRAMLIARRSQLSGAYFSSFVAYGISFCIGLQAMVNIGVSAGILPTKGLTLPLMSYGGSSLIVNCMMIAILLRIDFEHRWQLLGLGVRR